jgi:hypothetical protein
VTQLYDSAYYLTSSSPQDELPFVKMVLNKVLEEFELVYEYVHRRVSKLICIRCSSSEDLLDERSASDTALRVLHRTDIRHEDIQEALSHQA